MERKRHFFSFFLLLIKLFVRIFFSLFTRLPVAMHCMLKVVLYVVLGAGDCALQCKYGAGGGGWCNMVQDGLALLMLL